MSEAEDREAVRRSETAGWGDAVTFAWGDPRAERYGSLRLGVAGTGASALALLFAGPDLAASGIEAGVEIADPSWTALTVGDAATTVDEPLGAWTASWDGDEGGFDLRFEAVSAPLEIAAGGVEGYEQVCRVSGEVRTGDGATAVDCLGQRGHQWGAPDWGRLELSRTLTAWLAPDRAVSLTSLRAAGAGGHGDEEVEAWLLAPPEDGGAEATARRMDEARVSTAYDGEGRQRRAGLELWPADPEAHAERASGTVLCGTSLDLGRMRLDAAFFSWRMAGAEGVGRYDVMRRR